MRNRTIAAALVGVLLVAGCSGSGDDEPTATLAPVAPPAAPPGFSPPAPPATGLAPGTTAPDFGPPPGEMLATADLSGLPGAAGFTVRETFRPREVPGLCGEAVQYSKAWAAEAIDADDARLYGQVVYEMPDAAAAQALVAGLQSAEQGCSWTSGNFTTTYVRQETGVTPAGDAIFAYRASFAATGSPPVGDPGMGVYVQRGALVVFFGTPASTSVDTLNALIAASLA